MNESDRREKTMLDLFDWITDFVADRDDVTADDIRLAIAREFADGPRERDVLLAQYRERAEAAVRRLNGLVRQRCSAVDDALEFDPSWSIACVPSPPFDRATIARHWKAMKEEIKRLRLEVERLQNTGSHRPSDPEANEGSVR